VHAGIAEARGWAAHAAKYGPRQSQRERDAQQALFGGLGMAPPVHST